MIVLNCSLKEYVVIYWLQHQNQRRLLFQLPRRAGKKSLFIILFLANLFYSFPVRQYSLVIVNLNKDHSHLCSNILRQDDWTIHPKFVQKYPCHVSNSLSQTMASVFKAFTAVFQIADELIQSVDRVKDNTVQIDRTITYGYQILDLICFELEKTSTNTNSVQQNHPQIQAPPISSGNDPSSLALETNKTYPFDQLPSPIDDYCRRLQSTLLNIQNYKDIYQQKTKGHKLLKSLNHTRKLDNYEHTLRDLIQLIKGHYQVIHHDLMVEKKNEPKMVQRLLSEPKQQNSQNQQPLSDLYQLRNPETQQRLETINQKQIANDQYFQSMLHSYSRNKNKDAIEYENKQEIEWLKSNRPHPIYPVQVKTNNKRQLSNPSNPSVSPSIRPYNQNRPLSVVRPSPKQQAIHLDDQLLNNLKSLDLNSKDSHITNYEQNISNEIPIAPSNDQFSSFGPYPPSKPTKAPQIPQIPPPQSDFAKSLLSSNPSLEKSIMSTVDRMNTADPTSSSDILDLIPTSPKSAPTIKLNPTEIDVLNHPQPPPPSTSGTTTSSNTTESSEHYSDANISPIGTANRYSVQSAVPHVLEHYSTQPDPQFFNANMEFSLNSHHRPPNDQISSLSDSEVYYPTGTTTDPVDEQTAVYDTASLPGSYKETIDREMAPVDVAEPEQPEIELVEEQPNTPSPTKSIPSIGSPNRSPTTKLSKSPIKQFESPDKQSQNDQNDSKFLLLDIDPVTIVPTTPTTTTNFNLDDLLIDFGKTLPRPTIQPIVVVDQQDQIETVEPPPQLPPRSINSQMPSNDEDSYKLPDPPISPSSDLNKPLPEQPYYEQQYYEQPYGPQQYYEQPYYPQQPQYANYYPPYYQQQYPNYQPQQQPPSNRHSYQSYHDQGYYNEPIKQHVEQESKSVPNSQQASPQLGNHPRPLSVVTANTPSVEESAVASVKQSEPINESGDLEMTQISPVNAAMSHIGSQFNTVQRYADNGDCNAMYELAKRYASTKSETDMKKAVTYLNKASKLGHIEASVALGKVYLRGEDGISRDIAKAISYLRVAQQNPSALNALGRCYEIRKQYEEAFQCFKKASQLGHGSSLLNVGLCYSSGRGVQQDGEMARHYFEQAAQMGNGLAYKILGRAMLQGELGYDVHENQGFSYLIKALDHGCNDALIDIAECYQNGRGAEQSNEKAFEHYKMAAQSKPLNAISQFKFGQIYEQGILCEQNYTRALFWYASSCSMDYGPSAFRLGVIYENGIGTKKDVKKAYKMYCSAAEAKKYPVKEAREYAERIKPKRMERVMSYFGQ